MLPTLIVTVETEEDGHCRGVFRTGGTIVENVAHVPRLQTMCDSFGIRPTYLIDAAVVTDARASDLLGEIQATGRCEIGALLNPWCTPPIRNASGPSGPPERHLFKLPIDDQKAKLEWLTEQVGERAGRHPTAFRAGHFGLDGRGFQLLSEFGYLVDSTVAPFTDASPHGGANFSTAPFVPYFPHHNDLCSTASDGPVLEVPVTVGYGRGDFQKCHELQQQAGGSWLGGLGVGRILSRIGLTSRISMNPEHFSARSMKRLIDRCCELKVPSIVMTFRSSSLAPGLSPLVPDDRALEAFLSKLEDVFGYALHERALSTGTLSDFAAVFCGRTAEETEVLFKTRKTRRD